MAAPRIALANNMMGFDPIRISFKEGVGNESKSFQSLSVLIPRTEAVWVMSSIPNSLAVTSFTSIHVVSFAVSIKSTF